MYVTPFHCRPKPKICRPAQEHSRHELVTDCRPEPPCVVTDIPKRARVRSSEMFSTKIYLSRKIL